MSEGNPFGARKIDALQDAVMTKRIVQDQIIFIEQMADGRNVCRMAAHECNCIFDPDMPGESLFKIPMDLPSPETGRLADTEVP